MRKILLVFLIVLICVTTSCQNTKKNEGSESMDGYETITMDEAKELMETKDDYIILDVRTQEEYNEGHIPGAICIPNEEINEEKIEELPDTEQLIMVYCRSGNRSKQAAKKLADIGYTNIVEFGGIIDWEGDIVK